MEGLLILAAVYILEVVIKKVAASKKQKQNRQNIPEEDSEQESYDSGEQPQAQPKRSLQDLIRQFEEAQREASGGTYVPPAPTVEEDSDESEFDDSDFPVVTPANPGEFTFNEIAESVVQWEYVSADLLQEAFGFPEHVAHQVLAELQAKRVVGRDMGDGDCDLLVHDKVELENLFKRQQREAEEQKAAEAEEAALHARRDAELQHQKELAELEERARQLREQAGQSTLHEANNTAGEPCLASAGHRTHTRAFDKAEIRRGFIWAKVLDEPRFKKRWNSRVR